MGNGDPNSLEALGGGFNVMLEVLQDRPRRDKIVAKLRKFADVTDEIERVLDKKFEGDMLSIKTWLQICRKVWYNN